MTNDFQFRPKKVCSGNSISFKKKKKKNLYQKFSNFPAQKASNHQEREGKRELSQQTNTSNQIKFVSIHFWPMIRAYYFRLPVPPVYH